jgi:hypothetical protein
MVAIMVTPDLITNPRVTAAILNAAVAPIWKRRTFLVPTFTQFLNASCLTGRTCDLWRQYIAWRREQICQASARGQIPKAQAPCALERTMRN